MKNLRCNNVSVDDIMRVFSFESFKNTCTKRLNINDGNSNPTFLACTDCEIGNEIRSGKRITLPINVQLIGEENQIEVRQNGIKKQKKNPGGYKFTGKKVTIIEKDFCNKIIFNEKFTSSDLRYYWVLPLLSGKVKGVYPPGVCPSCQLPDSTSNAHGICKNCHRDTYKLSGYELLKGLLNKANRLRTVRGLKKLTKLKLSDNLIINDSY